MSKFILVQGKMDTRLKAILTTLAQQYAYALLPGIPEDAGRVRYLADGLANYGVLAMCADVTPNNYDLMVRTWIDNYHQLYRVFTATLFPLTGSGINLGLADQLRPPVAIIQAESTAVIQILAGYVVPYVAMRQQTGNVSDAEIRGLMAYILDDLEASDIERDKYNYLTREGSRIISQLITLPIQQYALTTMKRPLFQQSNLQPLSTPQGKPKPVPPATLPETGMLDPAKAEGKAKKETQFTPIWLNRNYHSGNTRPIPPVPLLPDDDD